MSLLKCIVCFFNFLAFAAGVTLIAGSAFTYFGVLDQYTHYLSDELNKYVTSDGDAASAVKDILIAGIVFGVIVALLGLLGCAGAMCNSPCLLGMFASILTVMLLAEVGMVVTVAVVGTSKFETEVSDFINSTAQHIETDSAVCDMFKHLAQDGLCCMNDGVQPTKLNHPKCNDFTCPKDTLDKTCSDRLIDSIKDNLPIAYGSAAGVIVLEFLAILCAVWLCCQIKNGKTVV